jgi:Flp pilus assembly protein TadD
MHASLPPIIAALIRDGRFPEALTALNEARKSAPEPFLFLSIADVLDKIGLSQAAENALKEGLDLFSEDTLLSYALALRYYKTDAAGKGLALTARAIRAPGCPEDMLVLHAALLRAHGDGAAARQTYEALLQKNPRSFAALVSYGGLHMDERDYTSAITCFERAGAMDAGHTLLGTQHGQCLLRMGDLRRGLSLYHARFGHGGHDPLASVAPRPFGFPAWQGERVPGPLLLWGEQGAGEEILGSTLFNDAKMRAETLRVECDARLLPLFTRSFPDITFIARQNPPDARLNGMGILAQSSSVQAAEFLRPDFSAFPPAPSCLKADPERTHARRAHYESIRQRMGKTGRIIGLSWKSKKLRHGDPKSTALADWLPLLENTPHLFVSLQYGVLPDEKHPALFMDEAVDQKESLDDFAAQIAALDGVVTVSNTTAHMAGALGIPGAVLLPASKGLMWHWFDAPGTRAEKQSLFYPSLTLLRQTQKDRWADAIDQAGFFVEAIR